MARPTIVPEDPPQAADLHYALPAHAPMTDADAVSLPGAPTSARAGAVVRRALGQLLVVFVLALATAWPADAVEPVALAGRWAPAGGADAAASRAFDPARLQLFGRSAGGATVLLYPRAGRWPEGPLVLSIASPGFQRISLHLPGVPPRSARLLDPGTTRWPGHGRLVFEVEAPPPAGAPLRLHVDARGAVPSPMTFRVLPVPAHLHADARWLAFATACLATMLVTALMALFFGLRLRDAAFGYYGTYVIAYALILGAQTGYIMHPLGWDALAAALPLWGRVATTLSVVAAVLFLDRFAMLDQWLPRMRPLLLWYCALMLGLLALGLVPSLRPAVQALVNPALILGGPLALVAAGAAAWRGSRYAALFLLGWVPLLAVTVLGSLQLYGVAADWTWSHDAALAAGAFESVVLTLGLAERAASVRKQRDQALALADLDPLTGVLNRRAWHQHVEVHAGMEATGRLSLLFLDLDHFKQVNDRIGHEGGDRVLRLFADVMRRALRGQDVLGRYGGEEFVVALPGLEAAQACAVAERIRESLHTASTADGMPLTVSIGVAVRQPGEALQGVLRRADAAVYAAKDAGRDRVVVG